MSEDTKHIYVEIAAKYERKPKRRHPVRDILLIGFACALVSVPLGSIGAAVFPILWVLCTGLYMWAHSRRTTRPRQEDRSA